MSTNRIERLLALSAIDDSSDALAAMDHAIRVYATAIQRSSEAEARQNAAEESVGFHRRETRNPADAVQLRRLEKWTTSAYAALMKAERSLIHAIRLYFAGDDGVGRKQEMQPCSIVRGGINFVVWYDTADRCLKLLIVPLDRCANLDAVSAETN